MTTSGSNNPANGMMTTTHGGHMSGGMIAMGLFWLVIGLLLATALVLGIIALLKYLRKGTNTAALDTLNDRYARGDISREAYNQIKKDMEGKQ